MQLYDAIEEMAGKAGMSFAELDNKVNATKVLSAARTRGSVIKCDALAKLAVACGYELCLVPYDAVPRSAIAISPMQKEDGRKAEALRRKAEREKKAK